MEDVRKVAGGRVYTGTQAIAAKLVDAEGAHQGVNVHGHTGAHVTHRYTGIDRGICTQVHRLLLPSRSRLMVHTKSHIHIHTHEYKHAF